MVAGRRARGALGPPCVCGCGGCGGAEMTTLPQNVNVMDLALFDQHSQAQRTLHAWAGPMLRDATRGSAEAALCNGDRSYGILLCGAASGQNDLGAVVEDVLPVLREVAPGMQVRMESRATMESKAILTA